MADELLIPIAADTDVVTARQRGRDLAAEAGFSSGDQTVIAAAISEIARNKVDKFSLDYLVGLCAKAGVSVAVKLAA